MRYIVLLVLMFVISSYACDTTLYVKQGMTQATVMDVIPSDQWGYIISVKGYKNGIADRNLKGRIGKIGSDGIIFGEDEGGDPIIYMMTCCYLGYMGDKRTVIINTNKRMNFIIQFLGPGRTIYVFNLKNKDVYKFDCYLER